MRCYILGDKFSTEFVGVLYYIKERWVMRRRRRKEEEEKKKKKKRRRRKR